jgi:hypothetical protein
LRPVDALGADRLPLRLGQVLSLSGYSPICQLRKVVAT